MKKEEFLKLFNECLNDGSIDISAEHSEANSSADSWQTTNLTIKIKIGDEPIIFHSYQGN